MVCPCNGAVARWRQCAAPHTPRRRPCDEASPHGASHPQRGASGGRATAIFVATALLPRGGSSMHARDRWPAGRDAALVAMILATAACASSPMPPPLPPLPPLLPPLLPLLAVACPDRTGTAAAAFVAILRAGAGHEADAIGRGSAGRSAAAGAAAALGRRRRSFPRAGGVVRDACVRTRPAGLHRQRRAARHPPRPRAQRRRRPGHRREGARPRRLAERPADRGDLVHAAAATSACGHRGRGRPQPVRR